MKAEVKKFLADFVKKVIETWVKERKVLELPKEFPEELKVKKGIFVTLLKNGELRGCIGIPYPVASILENAREAAILATQDPRFFPLSENELRDISIEISILEQPKKIEFKDEAELLKKLDKQKGLILKKRGREALFLPQVWEILKDKKLFLSELALKAGLSADEWKDSELYEFEAEIIKLERPYA